MAARASIIVLVGLLLLGVELASSSGSAEQTRQPSRSRIAFLGTGASSSLPDLRCVVTGATSGDCAVCTRASSGVDDPNFRGNVCLLLTIVDGDGCTRQILLDCGKTFRAAALRFFARLGVDGVDAILITHDHADALLGLDDIRSVQRYDPVQRLVLDSTAVFCDRRTFAHCARAFPYLMPRAPEAAEPKLKRFVSNLDWRPFDDHASFDVCGLQFTSLPVEHGVDYLCTGYAWGPDDAKCVVLSDYTAIGPEVYAKLRHWSTGGRRIALLVLDALARDNPPRVHASLEQSLALARELRPLAARFVGMSHGLEHGATNAELRALLDSEGLDCQLAHDGLEMHVDF